MGVIQGVVEAVQDNSTPHSCNINRSAKTRNPDYGFCDPRSDDELKSAPRPPLSVNPLKE